jgi:hypothetical protein
VVGVRRKKQELWNKTLKYDGEISTSFSTVSTEQCPQRPEVYTQSRKKKNLILILQVAFFLQENRTMKLKLVPQALIVAINIYQNKISVE